MGRYFPGLKKNGLVSPSPNKFIRSQRMELDKYRSDCTTRVPIEGRKTLPRLPMPSLEPERDPLRGRVVPIFVTNESIQVTRDDLFLNRVVDILEAPDEPLEESPNRGDRLMILHVMALEWNGSPEIFVHSEFVEFVRGLFPGTRPQEIFGSELLRLDGITAREIVLVKGFDENAFHLYKPFFSDQLNCYSVIKHEMVGRLEDWETGAFNYHRQRRLKYRFKGRTGWFDEMCERLVVSEYLRKIDLPQTDEMIDRVIPRLK